MSAAVLKSGVYFIQNTGTGTVVDLAAGSSANGTRVQGFVKRELADPWVPAQLFVISQVGSDPIYTIENTNSRTFLTLNGTANQSPVQGYAQSNADNQKWFILRNQNNTAYVIRNKATSTYFDLFNGGVANTTPINGWAGSGVTTTNTHQLWHIVEA